MPAPRRISPAPRSASGASSITAGIVPRTTSTMPGRTIAPAPMRSVSLPATGIVSIAPTACGSRSRPASNALRPRASWKYSASRSREPKNAPANSSTVAVAAATVRSRRMRRSISGCSTRSAWTANAATRITPTGSAGHAPAADSPSTISASPGEIRKAPRRSSGPAPEGASRDSTRAASASVTAPIGRLRKKMSRQEALSTSAPPTIGPIAGASSIGTPTSAITRPIRSCPAARARIVIPTGITIPPPSPCSTRNAISVPADQASPHSADPQTKTATAVMNPLRAPKRSTAQPANGITAESASRYAVDAHWIVVSGASKTTPSRSIAMLTIVVSRIVITAPSTTTPATARTGRPSSRTLRGPARLAGRRDRLHHVVAEEPRGEAQPRARAAREVDPPLVAAHAREPEPPCRHDLAAGPDADRHLAALAALRARDGRRKRQIAGHLEPERGARVARRVELQGQAAGAEAADGDGLDCARGLVGGVDGARDQRVAADVAAAGRVLARVRRNRVLADEAIVVEELDLGDAAVVGRAGGQRRRLVGRDRGARGGRRPGDHRRAVVGAADERLARDGLAVGGDLVELVGLDGVDARVAHHAVGIAVAGVDRVGGGAAVQPVAPAAPRDGRRAAAGADDVASVAPGHRRRHGRRGDDVLHVGVDVVALARHTVVGHVVERDGDRVAGGDDEVDAVAAPDRVGPVAALEPIVPGAAVERGARGRQQRGVEVVVAVAPARHDLDDARAGEDGVRPGAAGRGDRIGVGRGHGHGRRALRERDVVVLAGPGDVGQRPAGVRQCGGVGARGRGEQEEDGEQDTARHPPELSR